MLSKLINPLRLTINTNKPLHFFSRYKHEDPLMKRRTITQIWPPPGHDLKLPDWTPTDFCKRIGYGTVESADKFETLEEMFKLTGPEMKVKEVHVVHRKYI